MFFLAPSTKHHHHRQQQQQLVFVLIHSNCLCYCSNLFVFLVFFFSPLCVPSCLVIRKMSPNTHGQESAAASSRSIEADVLHASPSNIASSTSIQAKQLPTPTVPMSAQCFEPLGTVIGHHEHIAQAGARNLFSSSSSFTHTAAAASLAEPAEDFCTGNEFIDYFGGRNVFITGGTGFVGKVLIEKLLYEFRNIGKIYIMLRPKAGRPIRKRLDEMIEGAVFERVRKECPQQFDKLHPIAGDVGFPGLGINPMDMHTLIDNVSIVFHSAATIRFDDPLGYVCCCCSRALFTELLWHRYALQINTLGTKRILQLVQKLRNLSVKFEPRTPQVGQTNQYRLCPFLSHSHSCTSPPPTATSIRPMSRSASTSSQFHPTESSK